MSTTQSKAVLPNLLILGAQKSATTWLGEVLRCHPEVFVVPGEPQFFNRDGRSFSEYLTLFQESSEYEIRAEKTPDYLHMSTSRIRKLKKSLRDVRFIVLLRSPQERAWSQARMEVSAFNQRSIDKDDLYRLARSVVSLRNRDRCRYTYHLKRWLRVFDQQAFFIGFYEDILRDEKLFLTRLANWLGVSDQRFAELPSRVWESPVAEMPSAIRAYLDAVHGNEAQNLRSIGLQAPAEWDLPATGGLGLYALLPAQLQMFPANFVYRIYDAIRGQLGGVFTDSVNRFYTKRFLASR